MAPSVMFLMPRDLAAAIMYLISGTYIQHIYVQHNHEARIDTVFSLREDNPML